MARKNLEGERCDFCDTGKLELKHVREIYRHREKFVIIDNVPAYVCNVCRERCHRAEVGKRMRDIAENKQQIRAQITVPVAEFESIV
ncbi:MAG: YgiT-type zinc finger protein [bacterium]